MAYINKKDSDGTKPLLAEGELGYDKYVAGGDVGRVYVGTGTANIPFSKKVEVDNLNIESARRTAKSSVSGLINRPSQLFTEISTANTLRFNGKVEPFGGYNKVIPAEDITFSAFPTTQAVTSPTGVTATAGDFVVLQPQNIATNGTFDSDTAWTKGTGWSIGAGVASCDGSQVTDSILSQNYTFLNGVKYTVKMDITVTAGIGAIYYDATYPASGITTSGTYYGTFIGDGTNNAIGFVGNLDFIGTVDNVEYFLHYEKYQCIQAATTQDLTNTTYFRPIDDIKVQQLMIPTYDPSTDTLSWTKPTYLAYTHLVDRNHTVNDLMTAYGYTEGISASIAAEGVWYNGDGNLYGAPFIWERYNLGKYHPILNPYGQYNGSDGNDWSASTDSFTNIYDCFVNIGTAEGRPEPSYVLNKVYLNKLITKPRYLGKPTWTDILQAQKEITNGTWEYAIDCDLAMVAATVATASSYSYSSGTYSKFVFPTGSLGTTQQLGSRTSEKVYGKLLSGTTVYEIVEIYPNESGFDNVYIRLSYGNLGSPTLTSISVQVYKETSNLSRGVQTHTDAILDTGYYPTLLLSAFSSGKSISGMTALLIGQDGTDYVGSGILNIILSKKMYKDLGASSVAYTSNNGTTWTVTSNATSVVTNDRSTQTTGICQLITYEAYSSVLQDATLSTRSISKVGEVVVSNSHSWHRGNSLTYSTGIGVGTGNGTNSLESRCVDNFVLPSENYIRSSSGTVTVKQGDIVYFDIVNTTTPDQTVIGRWFEYVFATGFQLSTVDNINSATYWKEVTPIPKHTTIDLDSSGNKASKNFFVLGETTSLSKPVLNIYTQELIWDTTLDNRADFTEIAVNTAITYTAGSYYYLNHVDFGPLYKMVLYCELTTGSWTAVTLATSVFENDKNQLISANNVVYFTKWDGNGFGDIGTFDKLFNSTDLDANGNTIIISHKQVQL